MTSEPRAPAPGDELVRTDQRATNGGRVSDEGAGGDQRGSDGAITPVHTSLFESTPVRRRILPRLATPAAPMGLSVLLHAGLLCVGAFIVWTAASPTEESPPGTNPDFDAPEFIEGPTAELVIEGPARAPFSFEPAPSRPLSGEVKLRLDPTPPQPETENMPRLNGLASRPDALERDGLGRPVLERAAPTAAVDRILGDTTNLGEVVFVGLGASGARSVVYVIDGSGPMVTTLPLVIAEVERSVGRLRPTQSFSVVVFHRARSKAGEADDDGAEVFSKRLVRATPGAKQRLCDWLKAIEPGGQSNPLDGLRSALALRPQAVFLLSRGIERSGGGLWEQGMGRTLRELDRLNPAPHDGRRATIIKTVQFLDEDPTGIMQAIGEVHGGLASSRDGAGEKGYTVIRSERDLAATIPTPVVKPAPE
ncbi:MAG: hypothetical protein H7Y88_08525 [Phycisphaerales bacterium]|nr:hypothetical protein [Phycisphaerales bacterium]